VVDAVSNILFGRSAFKVEAPPATAKKSTSFTSPSKSLSASSIAGGGDQSATSSGAEESNSLRDLPLMFPHFTDDQLIRLVDCLLATHAMARHYNNSAAQRTILWKAAFKGKVKPNLQKLEAHSIHCALNTLFQLYGQTAAEGDEELLRGYLNRLRE